MKTVIPLRFIQLHRSSSSSCSCSSRPSRNTHLLHSHTRMHESQHHHVVRKNISHIQSTLIRSIATSTSLYRPSSKQRRHTSTLSSQLSSPIDLSFTVSCIHTASHHNQQQQVNLQAVWDLPVRPPQAYLPEATLPAVYRKDKYRSKHYNRWLKLNDYIPAVIVRGGLNAYRNPIYIAVDKYRWNEQRTRGILRSRIMNIVLPKHHIEATADHIVYADRNQLVMNASFSNSNINDTATESISIPCIMTTTYEHPVTDRVEHIQFQEFHSNERIKISMYVDFDGLDDCIGVKRGGVFQQLVWDIPLWYTGSRENLPIAWHINVQNLHIGKKIRLFRDVPMPDNCKLVHSTRDYVFCSMIGSSKLKGDEDDVAAVGAEAGQTTAAGATSTTAQQTKAQPQVKKLTAKQEELRLAAAAIASKQKP